MNLIICLILIYPHYSNLWKLVDNPKIIEKLALSKDQLERIEGILYETSERLITLNSEVEKNHLILRRELRKDSPNLQKVKDLIKEIGNLKTERRLELVMQNLKIREVLSSEQWKKFRRIKRKAMIRRK